jgi:hypothetical protein
MTVGDTKMVVAMTSASVVGLGLADGKRLWGIPFAVTGRGYNACTPVVDGQAVVFAGTARGTKKAENWRYGTSGTPWSPPATPSSPWPRLGSRKRQAAAREPDAQQLFAACPRFAPPSSLRDSAEQAACDTAPASD